MELREQQNKVKKGVVVAIVCSAFFIAASFSLFPFVLRDAEGLTSRLVFTIQCELFAGFVLFAAIATVGNQRFLSRDAIEGTTNLSGSIEINRRFLQNTLEQLILAIIAHFCLVTVVDPSSVKIVPILVGWWILARLAFWYGYHRTPVGRAFGFAATMYPTVAAMLYSTYKLLISNH